jgi:predicted aspartyl protease
MFSHRANLGLLLILPLFGPLPAWAETSCALKKLSTMAAQITPDNQLLVQTKIGDTPVPMLLDSGATWNGISHPMAKRLGLEFLNANAEIHPIGGSKLLNERVTISELALGTTKVLALNFFALGKGGDGTDGKAAGVLSATDRKDVDIEIDPAASAVNLFDQDHCTGKVVYWSSEYSILPLHIDPHTRWLSLDVEVDGQKLIGIIDTGASWTSMPAGPARDKFGLTATSPGVSAVPEGMTIDAQPMETAAYNFQTMKIGDIVIHNPRIMITPLRYDADLGRSSHINTQSMFLPDIFIGMNVLKNLHMFIAYSERAIYYTGANAGRTAAK